MRSAGDRWRSARSPACGGGADGPGAADAPHFVADSGGIDHRYEGDFQYFVGGGVAAFDCDDDGRSELFLAGGSAPAALYHNESPTGGALRFTPLPSPVTDLTAVTGAYPLDVDGDGHTDLAVLRVGEDVVLRGLGDCRFERANEALGIDGGDTWTVAFSATWEGVERPAHAGVRRLPRAGSPVVRGQPPAATGARRRRIRARRSPSRPATARCRCCSATGAAPGRRDLRLTNDRHYYRDGSDQLWRVAPGEAPRLYTEADGWRPLQIWGMGIASEDLTGDGHPEVFLTSQGDNKLQTLADGPTRPAYEDIALARGATAHRPFAGGDVLPSTAWHAEFADVNNDGFADLFVAKGNVEAEEGYATRDPEQPADRPGRRHVRRGSRGRRDRQLRPGARRRRSSTSTSTGCSTSSWSTASSRSRCGATPAGATPTGRSRWARGSPSACASRRPTSTPSARGWRRGSATARRSTR